MLFTFCMKHAIVWMNVLAHFLILYQIVWTNELVIFNGNKGISLTDFQQEPWIQSFSTLCFLQQQGDKLQVLNKKKYICVIQCVENNIEVVVWNIRRGLKWKNIFYKTWGGDECMGRMAFIPPTDACLWQEKPPPITLLCPTLVVCPVWAKMCIWV